MYSVVGIVLALGVFCTCFSVWIGSRLSRASTCEAVDLDFRLGVCTCAPRATVSEPGNGQVVITIRSVLGPQKRLRESEGTIQRAGVAPGSLGRFGRSTSMRRISSEGATRIASESPTIAVKDGL